MLLIMSVVLLVVGVLLGVYSEWFQTALVRHVVAKINENPDMDVRVGSLRLRFPLNLEVKDVLLVDKSDTIVKARSVKADVELLPLLKGTVALKGARLTDVRYQMGAPDSASCLVIAGRDIRVDRSTVGLSPLDIHVSEVDMKSPSVTMFINPADTFPATPSSEPSPLNITVDKVKFDNLRYGMQLMPTIYQLSAEIAEGSIDGISVDVMKQTVCIGDFEGRGLNAVYLMPDSAQIESTMVVVKPDTVASAPWTVTINSIDFTESEALYTTYGYEPLPGLDFGYIEVSDISLHVRKFYNQASVVKLPFDVTGTERCGLALDASGELAIDSLGLTFKDFAVKTPTGTDLYADGYMGTVTPLTDGIAPLSLAAKGNISVADVKTMFPGFSPYFVGMRKGAEILADVDVTGTSGDLDIKNVDLKIDRHIKVALSGNVRNVFSDRDLSGNAKFDIAVSDVSNWTADLLAGSGVVVPTMKMKGSASFSNSAYKADVTAFTNGGKITLKGALYGTSEKYTVNVNAVDFPVSAFLPTFGLGRMTAVIRAEGKGFDLFSKATRTDVSVNIASIEYMQTRYGDIALTARIGDDDASLDLNSGNPGLDFHLQADGAIENGKYYWDILLKSNEIDLHELDLSDTSATVAADLQLKADISKNLRDIDATLTINSASYNTPESELSIDRSRVILSTSDSLTNLSAQNRDLYAFFSTPLPLDSIMKNVDRVSAVIDNQVKSHDISIPEIQRTLMPFTLDIEGGNDNVVAKMLAEDGMHFDRLSVLAGNDTTIYLEAFVDGFSNPSIRLDSITFDIRQLGERLDYKGTVNNRPGTFDQWAHVNVDGFISTRQIGINLKQQNIKNQTGFDLGATLSFSRDSTMTLHLEPYTPIINYRQWSLNQDNFIKYDLRHHHLDADLMMKSDVSRIALYTEHANDTAAANHGADEDLVLQLFDIQLQDWIALDPFAPPIKGNLSAGVRVNWEDDVLSGQGTVDLSDLMYGKEKVGDFNVDVDLFTDTEGRIKAKADMWINGVETVSLTGALNDSTSTSPLNLDLTMIHLPLSVANPFLPGIAKLGGSLNGRMDIKGDMASPRLDGYLAFEDATVDVSMLGSTFTLNRDTIPIRENIVKFNNFGIKGVNENPLLINGDVNMTQISNPSLALNLKADNMQLVNTNKARKGADVYGKAFVSLNANAKGNLHFLNIDANVSVLPGTNVTYVLAGGTSALESQAAGNMVKFVNFADTAAVAAADSLKLEGMIVNLNATLNIQTGSIINVDLGSNVQDRVQLQGSGTFNYVSSPVGAGRLTGRYTFSGGFIKYAPPLISNINFGFTEGSYVAFSGDITNPQLHVKAVEKMRANVSQAGQNSRLIYFDIILSVTGSLENMNVAFDLETDDDITVANELASMSPTQRASEAMNLLLYNTYTGGSTKATSNLNGNPLFSFLTNSVNSWLANNVRGVDLSIGVDQYDRTTNGVSSTTTSYSYQVSKTLFNDRIKIVVGGSYSDDPGVGGSVAENLINDISVEYFLNNARTMYLRLFRHTGYESILEGEITQTGVGFVYRKRISRLSDMFIPSRYRRRHHEQAVKAAPEPESDSSQSSEKTDDAPTNDSVGTVSKKDENDANGTIQ